MGDKTERYETWVCELCRIQTPEITGIITVHGGTHGRVWCPWCGDAMTPAKVDHAEYHEDTDQ